jgi:hypothetical protein
MLNRRSSLSGIDEGPNNIEIVGGCVKGNRCRLVFDRILLMFGAQPHVFCGTAKSAHIFLGRRLRRGFAAKCDISGAVHRLVKTGRKKTV